MSMENLAGWVRARTGWHRPALACAAGVASVLAMAPFHVWPVLFLTLAVLVWQIDGVLALPAGSSWRHRPAVRAGLVAWWFAFGYFFAGLFWIGEAFLVEADKFAFLIPLAVTLMPAGLALFWAGAAAVASLAWRPGLTRVLSLALALAVAEWLRGHIFTGFPWNVIGYALTYPESLMQSAGLIGIYGLSLVAVVVLAAPLVAWADGVPMRGVAISLGTIAALMVYGHWRLAELPPATAEGPRVRLVQPSVPQREKWQPQHQRRIFDLHLGLTARNAAGMEDGAKGVDLVIWPEAAMPFLPLETPVALEELAKALPEGTHLLSGGLRADPPDPSRPGVPHRIYNSLIAFGAGAKPVAIYDKIHLVPFGEYLPLNTLLDAIGLEPLTRRRGGFTPGPDPRPLMTLPRMASFSPLICYEAIFPRAIVQGEERPSFLVNVTNDGWFGNTTGPRQHLQQARVRAVEEGLPLLRVANNGISALIDARGRVLHRLDLDVVGVIDARVPPAMPPTVYSRIGDLLFAFMLLCGAAVVFARQLWQARAPGIS
jgi:apolipoprotein N-acyltransferase